MHKLAHEQIVARQKILAQEPKISLCVVLDNIRSLFNVGSIFRTCDGLGVEKIWLCGLTGHPPQSEISKTALGAEEHVSWEHRRDTVATIKELKKKYQIVLLEQMDESISYEKFIPKRPVCLIVGNEVEGVSDEIVELADAAIEIPMAGVKNSLNVTVAFGVAAYHIRKMLLKL